MTGPREAAELEGKDEGHRIETESSKHRFRCELNFNENEDAEWQSDDAAVIGETMVTERGRILSVINKTQLHKSLAHGHQIKVNMSKAQSSPGKRLASVVSW